MKKPRELVEFLFGTSQLNAEQETLVEGLSDVWEKLEHQEELEPKKTPLGTALKTLGIKDATLVEDPEGFCFTTDDEQAYHATNTILSSPDAIQELAELGWVSTRCGDVAMSGEPPEFKFRFIEITTPEADNKETAPGQKDLSAIVKAAREFATEPAPKGSDGGPVPAGGVGKTKSGEKAKSAIKDSQDPDILVSRLLDEVGEGEIDCKGCGDPTKEGEALNGYCPKCAKRPPVAPSKRWSGLKHGLSRRHTGTRVPPKK